MNKLEEILSAIGILFLAIIFFIIKAVILIYLWKWFIVPIMSFKELSIMNSIGIMIIIDFFYNRIEKKPTMNDIFQSFYGKLIIFGMGYLVHIIGT